MLSHFLLKKGKALVIGKNGIHLQEKRPLKGRRKESNA